MAPEIRGAENNRIPGLFLGTSAIFFDAPLLFVVLGYASSFIARCDLAIHFTEHPREANG
ncbi:MAG: hypothetical protein V2I41_10030 [Pseudomonadales bacterium]|nr:hypothetical protein [Pseudomonadales bacterium]